MLLQYLIVQCIPAPHVLYWIGKLAQTITEIFILFLCKFFSQQVKQGGQLLYYVDTFLENSPFQFRFKFWMADSSNNEVSYQNASKAAMEDTHLEAKVQWNRMTESFWKVCKFRVTEIPVFTSTTWSLLLAWIWYIDMSVKYGILRAAPDALNLLEAGYLKAFVDSPMHPTSWLLSNSLNER